ncbi:MAG TPA: DUF305 domain-containing protein [Actinomycetales bacterium]|nr:DUF305 domain-containing protein [Actinomycetales bacterium]
MLLRRALPALLAGSVVLAGLSACSTDANVSTAPVVAPGKPGEPAEVLPPGTTFDPTEHDFDAADVSFVAGMIPHHQQALVLADLVPQRASDRRVVGLASRIADIQGAEIGVYRRWLSERGLNENGKPLGKKEVHLKHGEQGHGHAMPGMATDEELAELAALSGEDFDRRWLELMIAHHRGALQMADERDREGGRDVRADELAADVVVTQIAEIQRMEKWLQE